MDYNFVKAIEGGSITSETLLTARDVAVPGSHVDIILKESLYDKDYGDISLSERMRAHQSDTFMTSFPKEEFRGHDLLFRSEFLLLGYLGNDAFSFEGDTETYISHLKKKISSVRPRSLIYRLCDYNKEDFEFLRENEGGIDSRGAQRLIDQEALLDIDLVAMSAIADMGVSVSALIPCVQFPDQLEMLCRKLDEAQRARDFRLAGRGVMLELPANLEQIRNFPDVDFYAFGPGDLLKFYYGGVDRNDRNFSRVDEDVILRGVSCCLDDINALPDRKLVYLAKSLIGKKSELRLEKYNNIFFKDLSLPSQIMGDRACAGRAFESKRKGNDTAGQTPAPNSEGARCC